MRTAAAADASALAAIGDIFNAASGIPGASEVFAPMSAIFNTVSRVQVSGRVIVWQTLLEATYAPACGKGGFNAGMLPQAIYLQNPFHAAANC